MTLLSRITALSKDPWPIDRVNVPLDEMLEVLQAFQPGDTKEIQWMIDFFKANPKRYAKNIELLERMKAAAEEMEHP